MTSSITTLFLVGCMISYSFAIQPAHINRISPGNFPQNLNNANSIFKTQKHVVVI